MRHKTGRIFVAGIVLLGLVAVACGKSSTSSGAGGKLSAVPGFDGTTIRVGALDPATGIAAVIGSPLLAGEDVYFKALNATGGIAGKYPVQLVADDTAYQTNTAVQMYNKDKGNVVLFSQVMGTPIIQALLPLLKDDNVVATPASQDALWVREQQLLPIIEPYQIDVINGMSYYWNEAGGKGKTVGTIIQNDVYGEAGLEGLKFAGQELGFDIKTTARFNFGDQDFTAQITQLKNAGVQVVWAVAQPTDFGKMLGTAAALGYTPQWIAQSPAWIDLLVKSALKPYLEKYVWVTSVGPEWGDPTVPGMDKMIQQLQTYRPQQQPNYYFTFGYLQAEAVTQLLTKAVNMGDLSRAGIIKAMNSLKALTFQGVVGDYGYGTPDQRNPSRLSTVFKINSAKPFGLEALKQNFESPAATKYVFPVEK